MSDLGGASPPRSSAAAQLVLEHAVRAARIGTFDWDLDSGRLVADDLLLELYALAPPRHRSVEDFFARVAPADVERVRSVIDQAIARRDSFDAEYRLVLAGGETRWIAARGQVVTDEGGRPIRILGAAHDTTVHRETDARIATVMDSLSTAFFALDRSWRFSYVNQEAERVLGRRSEELLGGVVWELFPLAVGSDFETHYRHAMDTGDAVAFDAYYPEPLSAWYEVRAFPHPDGLAVHFLDITARRLAEDEARRAIGRARLVAQVAAELGATLDLDQALQSLSRVVVPALCDWSVVTLIADDRAPGTRGGLLPAGAWHVDPALRDAADRYAKLRLDALSDDAIVVRAVESGQEQLLEHDALSAIRAMMPPGVALELAETLAPESVFILPLIGPEHTIGMLTLCNGAARGAFSEEDKELARDVAARAGVVLDRARLYRQQQELAGALQRSLLTEAPHHDQLEFAARYVPAAEASQVGGDWYDAFLQDDGSAVLVIGDVMGHDMHAAAAMGQARSFVRAVAALTGATPAGVLADVERAMRTLRLQTTATAIVARLEPASEDPKRPAYEMVWSNAGHPPPVRIAADGTVTVLDGDAPDLLLGVVAATPRHESAVRLGVGDTMLLYTDGLVERRDQGLEAGLARLQGALAARAGVPLSELCDETLATLVLARPEDDVALIAVRVRAASPDTGH